LAHNSVMIRPSSAVEIEELDMPLFQYLYSVKVVCTNVDQNWSRINKSWIKKTTN